MSFWNPYKWRTAVAWVNPSAQAEDHQTDEGSIKTQAFVETAAADGWLLLDEEFGLVQYGESSAGREIAKKIGSERNGNGVGLCLTKELESMDWQEMLSALPEDLDLFKQQHPLDPHKPNYSPLLPEALRPYPSFEGWYVRVSDPSNGLSIALIMATNYVTDESQITLLFSPASSVDYHGNEDAKDDGDAVKSGYTYAVVVRTKDARIVEVTEPQEEGRDNLGLEPRGFEWIANGIGTLKVKPHSINVDFVVQGYRFKANLTKEAEFSLFSFLTMLPCMCTCFIMIRILHKLPALGIILLMEFYPFSDFYSRGPTMSVTFPCMHTGSMIHVLANCQNFGIIFLMELYVLLAL
jgi:hypothetical protein